VAGLSSSESDTMRPDDTALIPQNRNVQLTGRLKPAPTARLKAQIIRTTTAKAVMDEEALVGW
jgi:hypothetical protein